jgi:hypothetical protein
MLDTIDKLTEPTTCSLLNGTGINVELALAKVLLFQKACHAVPMHDGYVVVQITYVWANAGHYPLPVPIDGGDIETLAEALIQRIKWPKDRIVIPPMKRHPNPADATSSRGTTSDGGIATQYQQEKVQQQQQISKTTHQERRQQPEEPNQTPPKQQLQHEDKQQMKQQPLQKQQQEEELRQSRLHKGNYTRKPQSVDEIIICIIGTEQEPKYKPGAPMLSEADLEVVGPNCAKCMLTSWNTVRINLPFLQRWMYTIFKVLVL